jgi:hypothetical protein
MKQLAKKLATLTLIALSLIILALPVLALTDNLGSSPNLENSLNPLALAEDTEAEESVDIQATTSTPKPDFLPGPADTVETGSDTREFILNETIPRVMNLIIGLLGIATFLGIIMSAVHYLTAYGNEEKINKAKSLLQYSLMGFLLVIFAYAIISVIVSIALPQEDTNSVFNPGLIAADIIAPPAYAIESAQAATTIDNQVEMLFPDQDDLIEEHDDQGRVSLPSGDLVTEIVPAIITNILYIVGFLIFVGFTYGGVLMVIARGNEELTSKAKSIVIYSGIALAVIAAGYAIVYGIATLDLTEDPDSQSDNVYTETSFDFIPQAYAAITLDNDLRPANLPGVEIQDATDDSMPETAATQTLILFVGQLMARVLLFAGAVSVLALIVAGGYYILSFGKDDPLEKAKRGMFWAIGGLLIIMLSYAIVQGVLKILLQVDAEAVSSYNPLNFII